MVGAKLVGYDNFVRSNPKSDRFTVHKFDHLEYTCGDAMNTYSRFAWGLGMRLVAKSNPSTGNNVYSSYVLESGDIKFIFTAPAVKPLDDPTPTPHPNYSQEKARKWFQDHGLGVSAIGLLVDDATIAHDESVANGGVSVLKPTTLTCNETGKTRIVSEVEYVGDVVLRYIQDSGFEGAFLPNYQTVDSPPNTYGLKRIDHVVSNVPSLLDTVNHITKMTGFHEFAEFTAEDVGTVDSGLNSMVLANNSEIVLLPVNEPTFGTKRKSQIQTYLEQNQAAGVQHIAIKCDNIFHTLKELRNRTHLGGFDFMPRPSDNYYRNLSKKVGDSLTEDEYKQAEELGILVDKDSDGVLLQIFTKPVGDRMTLFIEIIQRIGCTDGDHCEGRHPAILKHEPKQMGGCGGFGKGNFTELFKSIEDYEKLVEETAAAKK